MANGGLKNENLIKRIIEKGSTALKGRNSFGVNVFSGSIDDDGVVSGKITKTKYDNEELVKSIDTNIFELLPAVVEPTPDVVPRPIYNEVTQSVIDLQAEVEALNLQVSDLQSLVNDLRIVSQSLRIELDSKDLVVASVENQSEQTVLQTQATIIDLQNAIQKATSEVIQRTSLSALNQTLQTENEKLIQRLEGKEAKLQEGYDVGETFAIKINSKSRETGEDIVFNSRNDANGNVTWINGPDLLINNFTENSITVEWELGGAISSEGVLLPPQSLTIEGKSEKTVTLQTNSNRISDLKPRSKSARDRFYLGTLTATSSDGGTISFSVKLEKQSGDSIRKNPVIVT
jgi:hypothetical protein